MTANSAKGVLFDMDGVLLDTEPLYTIAYDRLLVPHGARLDRATKLEVMGRPAIKSAAHVIKKFHLPMTPEEFLERRTPILEELFVDAPAVPGAEELVARLAEMGIPLAVATSTHRKLFTLKTRKHKWFSHFSTIVCGDDPEIAEPKPAPDIFLLAARRLGVAPQDCTVFEDSPTGAQAAVASQARAIALVREECDPQLFAGVYRIIQSYSELRFDSSGFS